jgi:hypothetical protein
MVINKVNDWTIINGTSLKGYTGKITRRKLEQVFGLPEQYGEGDKVTTEWIFTIDNEVGTIYDWKRYEQGAPDLDEPYDWHIGGQNDKIVKLIQRAITKSEVK